MAPKKSKVERGASKKLEEVLQLCTTLKEDLQSVQRQQSKKQRRQLKKLRQQLKKQRQQIRRSSDLIQELHDYIMKNQGPLGVDKAVLPDQSRSLELSFVCALPGKLFTASIIYAFDGVTKTNVPVRVALLDEARKVVNGDDLLSSLEIEIVVACGDLKAEEGSDVETRRIRPREEAGSLLVGSCLGKMQDGVCSFNDLKFVDNSSWVPSKTFKLVAKVVGSVKVPSHVQVRPAVSKAFRVIDQRGKQYEKHSVPSWNDQVWRLKKIRKNGPHHMNLEAQGIRTVMEFRRRYSIDQLSLRKTVGAKDGNWATIVQHANECCGNSQEFRYDSKEGVELLFDCFYQLKLVSFDHQNEWRPTELPESEKNLVEQVRQRALEDHSKLIQVNSVSAWPSANYVRQWSPPDPNPQQPPPHQGTGGSASIVLEVEQLNVADAGEAASIELEVEQCNVADAGEADLVFEQFDVADAFESALNEHGVNQYNVADAGESASIELEVEQCNVADAAESEFVFEQFDVADASELAFKALELELAQYNVADAGESTLNEYGFECRNFPESSLVLSAEDRHGLEDVEGFGALDSG